MVYDAGLFGKRRGTMESIFIVWSGNQDLANDVKTQLEAQGNKVTVGGGGTRGNYVGMQIINQMNSCNHAIILAQKKENADGSSKFSDNLMFEWGYLISKLPEGRVSSFLIDTDPTELPSDLAGSWTTAITAKGRDDAAVASEIVKQFRIERTILDKLNIMASWQEVKTSLRSYNTRHAKSDSEMAQYVLYSMLSAYYNDEVVEFDDLLSDMSTGSPGLKAIITMVRIMSRVYISTAYLAKPLAFDDYYEVVDQLTNRFEENIDPKEDDLVQWTRIIRLEHMQFCNFLMAIAKDDDIDDYYHTECLRLGKRAIELVEKNLQDYPENEYYAALLLSFLHRNMAIAFRELKMDADAKEHFTKSVEQRKKFFFRYRDEHGSDTVLCAKFSQEYYLALLEQIEFDDDPRKSRHSMMAVRKQFEKWREESNRQLALLHMVEETYDRIDKLLRDRQQQSGD